MRGSTQEDKEILRAGSLPRMRDRPYLIFLQLLSPLFPHAWGSTLSSLGEGEESLPCMRGTTPGRPRLRRHRTVYPSALGSTVPGPVRPRLWCLPACVGIDLESLAIDRMFIGLPRMRGDRPVVEAMKSGNPFTSHAWDRPRVFPRYRAHRLLPHARRPQN